MQIAVIGAGGRLCGMLGAFKKHGIEVAAIADPSPDRVRERLENIELAHDGIEFVQDTQALIDRADCYDGFAIGTRCHLHTQMASAVAATGKPLFLEKPVAITQEQLDTLAAAWKGREDRVVVSFPLRVTPVLETVLEIVRSGRLGVINQVQAVNNVPYGDVYFESWYRRFDQVGGLWLQKATHDFDYLNLLVGARAVRVAAMMTQRIFGTGRALEPDHEPTKDLPHLAKLGAEPQPEDISDADAALGDIGSRFHAAIRNQDSGSALIWYDNGVLVSYDQNFVARNAAGKRGGIITGYNGTLSWDWMDERARYIDHHTKRVDEMHCPSAGGHGGGDARLARSFAQLMQGQPNQAGNLKDGLLSVAMCLAARKAAQQHTVEPIPDLGVYPAADTPADPSGIEA